LTATLFSGGDTGKFARFETGVKGKRKVPTIEGDAILQNGTCKTPSGETILDEVFIEVQDWTYHESFCIGDLEDKLPNSVLAPGSNAQSIPLTWEQKIIEVKAASIQKTLELTYWQGDTAGTYTNFDGFIKKIDALGTALNGNTSGAVAITKGNIIGLVDDMVVKAPVDVKEDATFEVYVGNDVFDLYIAAVKDANNYHISADNDGETYKIGGSGKQLRKVRGLNGTDRMYATVGRNFIVGMDVNGEEAIIHVFYVEETDKVHFRTKAKSGVNVFNAKEIVEFSVVV
jgi:hypothetical protein